MLRATYTVSALDDDSDVADIVRCSEVDGPPRLFVFSGTRHSGEVAVNSLTGRKVAMRADLRGVPGRRQDVVCRTISA